VVAPAGPQEWPSMAARRLIALLVVLLVISSIAAALAPTPAEREETTTSPVTTTPADAGGGGGGGGELTELAVDVPPPRDGAGKDQPKHEPETIDIAVGDQLALTVRSERTATIEIPELGLLETAGSGAPARFDLLLREPGRLAVLAGGGRQVAWIVVRPAAGPAGSDKGEIRRKSTRPSATQPA
jgi:hypothetical protein